MKKSFIVKWIKTFVPIIMGLFFSISVLAQGGATIDVKGVVQDDLGPVVGANVVIKGTTKGASTDLDGRFSLKAPSDAVLVVSFVGYNSKEVAVSPNMTIMLSEDTELLDEVVVIGYGSVKKNDLTGSITTLKADELNKGLSSSTTDLLVGKIAGVNVVSAGGAPGAGASVRIRGGSSMNASNDPLYIIDGMPIDNKSVSGMGNPLSTINAADIESFTVLKDASATAIYGSRASNGVVIITTKKGKTGKAQIAYNGSMAIHTKVKSLDVMSGDTFRQFVIDKHGADSKAAQALGKASTDWQDEIFRTSYSTDHNISVGGVAQKVLPYRVSYGYTNENGILKTSNMERSTLALNLSPKFFDDMLSVQFNVKGLYMKNRFADTGAVGAATEFDPTQPVYVDNSPYGNGYYMSLKADGKPIDIGLSNPLAILKQKHDKSEVKRSIGNLQLDYKLHWLPELRANLNLAYDFSRSYGQNMVADNSPMSYTWGDNKKGWGENKTYEQYKRNQLMDFYLNYNKDLGKHHFDVMAGYSWQYFYQTERNKYPFSREEAANQGKGSYKDGDSKNLDYQLISFFGRFNYSFDSRYLLTATLRNDGSSRFSKDNRWGLFPSVALAWRVTDEGFMKNQSTMSDLKLRLGYGITGQQDLGSEYDDMYGYSAYYNYSKAGAGYYFGDQYHQLLRPAAYNPDRKWEETATYNIGVDYGFLGNRIRGALDVYHRKTNNMLTRVSIPAGANFSNEMITNQGEMTNRGVEFSLTANAIETKDLTWMISYNVAYNKSEIKDLGADAGNKSFKGLIHGGITGGTGNRVLIHQVGKPHNAFYVYEQIYDSNGKPIEGAYVDQDGNGVINEDDLIAYKKSAPDVTMGLSSQVNYKSWDLGFAMHASINNYIYNNVQANREAYGGSQMYDQSGFLKNRLSSAIGTNFQNANYLSSYYVQKGSFLKMDNITLGYNFKPYKFIQGARLYFTVSNPFVITKYDGLDPEFSGSSTDQTEGIDNNIYPHPRTYMIGLNLKF